MNLTRNERKLNNSIFTNSPSGTDSIGPSGRQTGRISTVGAMMLSTYRQPVQESAAVT